MIQLFKLLCAAWPEIAVTFLFITVSLLIFSVFYDHERQLRVPNFFGGEKGNGIGTHYKLKFNLHHS